MKTLPSLAMAGMLCLVSLGCGTSRITFPAANPAVSTTCETTPPDIVSNSQFQVNLSETTLSLYPGEATTVPVQLQSLDGALHKVRITASHLPSGLTITPSLGKTDSTTNLSFQATTALAADCFAGVEDVFNAVVSVMITATSLSGQTSSAVLNVNVVLENPAFVPTKIDLPVIKLATADGSDVTSADDYIDGTIQLTDSSNPDNNFEQTMEIKGHGNSTWAMPKKPYNVKLDSKEGVLGMAKAKHWILLANYDDKTMLRDALAAHISSLAQMEWSYDSRFVELYLNGKYEGVYQIAEKVEIDPNRLNIDELDDTDNSGVDLTGGYLMEIDNYLGATYTFYTPQNIPIDSDDPDPPTTEQASYITNYVDAAENALYSSNFTDPITGWPAYFDKDALVNWFIVEELMSNQDGDFWSSDYFYKKRNDPLLYMGPVWDFDDSSGNDNNNATADNPSLPYIRNSAAWYARLFQDPAFVALVKARWQTLSPQMKQDIPTYLTNYAATLDQGQQNNFARWPNLYQKVWPNVVALGTYHGEVTKLEQWMTDRLAYMDATYGK